MRTSILFLYTATILIWGSTWLAIKFQLGVVDSTISVVYRYLMAAVILFAWCFYKKANLTASPKQHIYLALQGFFLFGINYALVYESEVYLTSGVVAAIFTSMVFFNIVNGRIFLKTPINPLVFLGGILGMGGVVLLFLPEISQIRGQEGATTGFVLAILSSYAASLGNIIAKKNSGTQLTIMAINAWSMLYGCILLVLMAIIKGATLTYDPNPSYTISLIYLSLFGSVIAFGCYLKLMEEVGADKAAYSTMLIPVVALIISTFFEDYTWSVPAVIGISLICLGNIIVLRK